MFFRQESKCGETFLALFSANSRYNHNAKKCLALFPASRVKHFYPRLGEIYFNLFLKKDFTF